MYTSHVDRYFAPSYRDARRRFRDTAVSVGAGLEHVPLTCRGPDDGTLTIDLAWIGSRRPDRVLIHTSGIHGVEGFAGSAIQLKALEAVQPLGPADAIIFVHGLNPFGMAWLRRVNEHNVDLNRNWREPGVTLAGIPELYREIGTLLNPTVMRRGDAFYLRAARVRYKHGLLALRQAIAGGQYEDPRGLFYGGRHLEEGPARFRSWLERQLPSIQRISVIDVHTGLGRWRQNSLFFEPQPVGAVGEDELPQALTAHVAPAFDASDVGGYTVRGGQVDLYRQLFPSVPQSFVTQEFGTYSGVRVLKALRAENYQHHYGDRRVDHPCKQALRDAFCPRSKRWRASVLEDGLRLIQATMQSGQTPAEQSHDRTS